MYHSVEGAVIWLDNAALPTLDFLCLTTVVVGGVLRPRYSDPFEIVRRDRFPGDGYRLPEAIRLKEAALQLVECDVQSDLGYAAT